MSSAHPLLGARLRRLDAPFPDLLALTVAARELRGVLLIGLAQGARGVGFVDQRPGGSGKSPFLLRARKLLERGRIVALEANRTRIQLGVERGDQRSTLVIDLHGALGNARLLGAGGELIAALQPGAPDLPEAEASAGPFPDLATLRAEGARLLGSRGELAFEERKAQLARTLRAAERKLARRLAAVEADRARADQVESLRAKAALLLAQLHMLPKGGGAFELLDTAQDPPAAVTVEVDPKLGPRRQADAWFHAARRLERGAVVADTRAQQTRAEIAAMDALSAELRSAENDEALAAIAAQAERLGLDVRTPGPDQPATPRGPKPRLPYRRFAGSGERAILVGRGADDNDRLTLDHARPHDLWLHARDEAGAHVVVPLEKGEACPPELLCDAATLAAHFSQARGQARVDVSYVERRYVRKPRKSPPGQVQLDREKVFRLRLEPQRLARLLAAERAGAVL